MSYPSEVAVGILQQLGGWEFLCCTGSSYLSTNCDGDLVIELVENKSGANQLCIHLNGEDLYDLHFIQFTPACFTKSYKCLLPTEMREVKTFQDIFCDQLKDIFEEVTGLYVSLFSRGCLYGYV